MTLTKESIEKLTKTLVSDEFTEKLGECKTYEEVATVLNGMGVEITADELVAFLKSVDETEPAEDGALSEAELENVAGGWIIRDWIEKKINAIGDKIGYYLGGGWIEDIMNGKAKHPWVN